MIKDKERIDLEQFKMIRGLATKTNDDLSMAEKVKQDLTLKLLNIHKNCNHELVIRYMDNQVGYIASCLCCTKTIYGPMVGLDFCFQNLIDIPDSLQENNIPEFTLKLYEQERIKHPELSDAEIVSIINQQLKKQTTAVEKQDFVKSIGTKK